jgi:GGDEF domain-containing protein
MIVDENEERATLLEAGIVAAGFEVVARIIGGADLRAAVEAPIRLPGGLSVRVGVSIGIAVCPHDDETADELLRVADHRMYADKRSRKRRHGMTAKA